MLLFPELHYTPRVDDEHLPSGFNYNAERSPRFRPALVFHEVLGGVLIENATPRMGDIKIALSGYYEQFEQRTAILIDGCVRQVLPKIVFPAHFTHVSWRFAKVGEPIVKNWNGDSEPTLHKYRDSVFVLRARPASNGYMQY